MDKPVLLGQQLDLFPELDLGQEIELDLEGTTWKHEGSEKRWVQLVDKNRHIPGLATSDSDVDAFTLVLELMRNTSYGGHDSVELRHTWEALDFEKALE